MDLDLTDAQRLAAETFRAFADKEVAPRAEIDRTDEFPLDLNRRLAALGLLGMTLPAEYGGAGADTLTWTLGQEEIARASAAVAHAQLLCTILSELLPIERLYRDARVYPIFEGTSQRLVIARQLLREG